MAPQRRQFVTPHPLPSHYFWTRGRFLLTPVPAGNDKGGTGRRRHRPQSLDQVVSEGLEAGCSCLPRNFRHTILIGS